MSSLEALLSAIESDKRPALLDACRSLCDAARKGDADAIGTWPFPPLSGPFSSALARYTADAEATHQLIAAIAAIQVNSPDSGVFLRRTGSEDAQGSAADDAKNKKQLVGLVRGVIDATRRFGKASGVARNAALFVGDVMCCSAAQDAVGDALAEDEAVKMFLTLLKKYHHKNTDVATNVAYLFSNLVTASVRWCGVLLKRQAVSAMVTMAEAHVSCAKLVGTVLRILSEMGNTGSAEALPAGLLNRSTLLAWDSLAQAMQARIATRKSRRAKSRDPSSGRPMSKSRGRKSGKKSTKRGGAVVKASPSGSGSVSSGGSGKSSSKKKKDKLSKKASKKSRKIKMVARSGDGVLSGFFESALCYLSVLASNEVLCQSAFVTREPRQPDPQTSVADATGPDGAAADAKQDDEELVKLTGDGAESRDSAMDPRASLTLAAGSSILRVNSRGSLLEIPGVESEDKSADKSAASENGSVASDGGKTSSKESRWRRRASRRAQATTRLSRREQRRRMTRLLMNILLQNSKKSEVVRHAAALLTLSLQRTERKAVDGIESRGSLNPRDSKSAVGGDADGMAVAALDVWFSTSGSIALREICRVAATHCEKPVCSAAVAALLNALALAHANATMAVTSGPNAVQSPTDGPFDRAWSSVSDADTGLPRATPSPGAASASSEPASSSQPGSPGDPLNSRDSFLLQLVEQGVPLALRLVESNFLMFAVVDAAVHFIAQCCARRLALTVRLLLQEDAELLMLQLLGVHSRSRGAREIDIDMTVRNSSAPSAVVFYLTLVLSYITRANALSAAGVSIESRGSLNPRDSKSAVDAASSSSASSSLCILGLAAGECMDILFGVVGEHMLDVPIVHRSLCLVSDSLLLSLTTLGSENVVGGARLSAAVHIFSRTASLLLTESKKDNVVSKAVLAVSLQSEGTSDPEASRDSMLLSIDAMRFVLYFLQCFRAYAEREAKQASRGDSHDAKGSLSGRGGRVATSSGIIREAMAGALRLPPIDYSVASKAVVSLSRTIAVVMNFVSSVEPVTATGPRSPIGSSRGSFTVPQGGLFASDDEQSSAAPTPTPSPSKFPSSGRSSKNSTASGNSMETDDPPKPAKLISKSGERASDATPVDDVDASGGSTPATPKIIITGAEPADTGAKSTEQPEQTKDETETKTSKKKTKKETLRERFARVRKRAMSWRKSRKEPRKEPKPEQRKSAVLVAPTPQAGAPAAESKGTAIAALLRRRQRKKILVDKQEWDRVRRLKLSVVKATGALQSSLVQAPIELRRALGELKRKLRFSKNDHWKQWIEFKYKDRPKERPNAAAPEANAEKDAEKDSEKDAEIDMFVSPLEEISRQVTKYDEGENIFSAHQEGESSPARSKDPVMVGSLSTLAGESRTSTVSRDSLSSLGEESQAVPVSATLGFLSRAVSTLSTRRARAYTHGSLRRESQTPRRFSGLFRQFSFIASIRGRKIKAAASSGTASTGGGSSKTESRKARKKKSLTRGIDKLTWIQRLQTRRRAANIQSFSAEQESFARVGSDMSVLAINITMEDNNTADCDTKTPVLGAPEAKTETPGSTAAVASPGAAQADATEPQERDEESQRPLADAKAADSAADDQDRDWANVRAYLDRVGENGTVGGDEGDDVKAIKTADELRSRVGVLLGKRSGGSRGTVPAALRPRLWMELSGARELKESHPRHYYQSLVKESLRKEHRYDISHLTIAKDVHRTLPTVEALHSDEAVRKLTQMLFAYALRDPETVGYCQSMNLIAAFLLIQLEMNEEDAFWLLCRMVERHVGYYAQSMCGLKVDQNVATDLIRFYFPDIAEHIAALGATMDTFMTPWFLCLFIEQPVPLAEVPLLWDHLILRGDDVLYGTMLSLLQMNRDRILQTQMYEDLVNLLLRGMSQGLTTDAIVSGIEEFVSKMAALGSAPGVGRIDAKPASGGSVASLLPSIQCLRALHQSKHVKNLKGLKGNRANDMAARYGVATEELQRLWQTFLSPAPWDILLREGVPTLDWFAQSFCDEAYGEWHLREWKGSGLQCGTLQRLFDVFDVNTTGQVSFDQYVFGVYVLTQGRASMRRRLAFEFCDFDGDGFVSRDDLRRALTCVHALYQGVRPQKRGDKKGAIDGNPAEAGVDAFVDAMFSEALLSAITPPSKKSSTEGQNTDAGENEKATELSTRDVQAVFLERSRFRTMTGTLAPADFGRALAVHPLLRLLFNLHGDASMSKLQSKLMALAAADESRGSTGLSYA